MPELQNLVTRFYHIILQTPYRTEIENKYGKHLLNLAELSVKAFKPEIIEDLQEENKLSSEYSKLVASASIQFEGEERNLSGLIPFMEHKERAVQNLLMKPIQVSSWSMRLSLTESMMNWSK